MQNSMSAPRASKVTNANEESFGIMQRGKDMEIKKWETE